MRGRLPVLAALLLGAGLACAGGEAVPPPPDPPPSKHEGDQATRGGTAAPGAGTDRAGERSDRDRATGDAPPAGITALGGDRWSVKRRLVRRWQDNPSKLADATQGKKGWVLHRVPRRDARWLGFANGDEIRSINGHSLGTAAETAAAYQALQGADTLRVKFRRDGQARVHTYEVVD